MPVRPFAVGAVWKLPDEDAGNDPKFHIVIGVTPENLYTVRINTDPRKRDGLTSSFQATQLVIHPEDCSILSYRSIIDCSKILTKNKSDLNQLLQKNGSHCQHELTPYKIRELINHLVLSKKFSRKEKDEYQIPAETR